MIQTSMIAAELPFLRRYARALTGSQRLGDAAVRSTLEAILEAPEDHNFGDETKFGLFQVFHQAFDADVLVPLDAAKCLDHVDTLGRQALLLTAVEGFSLAEAAVILEISEDAVSCSLEDAKATISDMLKSQILIIEDETVIAMHIQAIITESGHEALGIARTHREAVSMANALKPELVLADISLADGSSGIDAARDILDNFDVPIIFVTAFPERLLTGERPEPTFLITKPFEPVMLSATIAQALMTKRERDEVEVAA